jgi:hypothetical protein
MQNFVLWGEYGPTRECNNMTYIFKFKPLEKTFLKVIIPWWRCMGHCFMYLGHEIVKEIWHLKRQVWGCGRGRGRAGRRR